MSLFALDTSLLTDIVLWACAIVFVIAVAFRLVTRGKNAETGNGPVEEDWDRGPAEETVGDSRQFYGGGEPPNGSEDGMPGGAEARSIDVKRLFTEIAQQDPAAVVSSAEEMLEHLRERSGGPITLTTDQERLAMQFGIIELALRKASYDQVGESCVLPNETVSEIIREGFRMVSSKSG